ncbi:MAG: NFACT RNA binding domain-containing protein [archaeon]
MDVEIDVSKTVEQNAAKYYEEAKKYRKKIEGLKKAIESTKRLISEAKEKEQQKTAVKKHSREKEWFEKYHWMNASGRLVIGGRDAKTNETLVKKYMEANDLFFHSDVHGASAVIVKDGQSLDDDSLKYVAQFAGSFSSAWKEGRGTVDVYCVKPEQVKTSAKSGEYLAKGSFVIAGERKYFKNVELSLALTFENGKLVIKPPALAKGKKVIIRPDAKKTKGESSKFVFKKLKEIFPEEEFDVNWVQELLPNGGSRVS